MSGSKRVFLAFVVFVAALAVPAAALAVDEDISDVPISVTALTAADLVARLTPTDAEFIPITDSPSAEGSSTRILATAATAWTFADPITGFIEPWIAETDPVLSGPQGTLFGHNAITTRNIPDPAFYSTRPEVTAYLAKIEPLPELTDEEIFEISLAFNWAQDELLTSSPFDYDPLLGYGNVVSFGWFAGQEFDNYAKVIDQAWTQFGNSVLTFEFTDTAGDFYIGFVLPGVPEGAGFTMSYADEPTPERMIAQHVPVVTPPNVFQFPSLEATYGDLDPALQDAVVGLRETIGTEDPEAVVPPPEDEDPPPDVAESSDTEGEETTEDPPVVEEETSPPNVAQDAGTDDTAEESSSGIPPWLLGLFFIILIVLAWLILRSFLGRRQPPPTPSPPGSVAGHDNTARLIAAHQKYGGTTTSDGWIAPTHGAVMEADPMQLRPWGPVDEWSEAFVNVKTGEVIERGHPRYEELMAELGVVGPIERNEATLASATDAVVAADAGGTTTIDPPASTRSTPTTVPAEPDYAPDAVALGMGLQALITSRNAQYADGIAAAHGAASGPSAGSWIAPTYQSILDGGVETTVDPALRDSWAQVFINTETKEWITDVDPRFGGLVMDLGLSAPDPGPPLVDWGGPPGSEVDITALEEPSQSNPFDDLAEEDAIRRRQVHAYMEPKARGIAELHNRTGGIRTEDGWTAPTNQTVFDGIATSVGAPPEPGRGQEWSGIFINDITLEWVFGSDPGWQELIERTGVQPPTEGTDPVGFDDTMGPIS